MMSQPGKQTIARNVLTVLPNISGSKGNQTIRFGQLIAHKTFFLFLKNHIQK